MYVCFVTHPDSNQKYLFDCTDLHSTIAVGSEVVCQTYRGLQRGTVVSYPVQMIGSGAVMIIEAIGAYWPLKKIVRKFGDVDLLPEERRQIARQYIADHDDYLPF